MDARKMGFGVQEGKCNYGATGQRVTVNSDQSIDRSARVTGID